jgi:hypothetical protein
MFIVMCNEKWAWNCPMFLTESNTEDPSLDSAKVFTDYQQLLIWMDRSARCLYNYEILTVEQAQIIITMET